MRLESTSGVSPVPRPVESALAVRATAFEFAPDGQAVLSVEADGRFTVVAANHRLREHLRKCGVNAPAEALVGAEWSTVLRATGLVEPDIERLTEHCRAVARGAASSA